MNEMAALVRQLVTGVPVQPASIRDAAEILDRLATVLDRYDELILSEYGRRMMREPEDEWAYRG